MAKTLKDLRDLTFWPGNSVQHIVTSWVVFMLYIKQIGQIGTERNMTWTFCVWRIVPSWVLFVPHMKWIGQIAMEQTSRKLPTTHMIWPSAFWPRNGPHDLFLGHISIRQIGRETQSGYGQNFQRACVTCTFDPLKWKWCVTHHDLMGCICATYRWARKT